jgi:hypothetical protein
MADELTGLLKDISVLLRKQTEQQEASTLRMNQWNEEREEQRKQFAADHKKRQEESEKQRLEMQARHSTFRELDDKKNEEEREFRQRLLSALNQQNRLLEGLLGRLEKSQR